MTVGIGDRIRVTVPDPADPDHRYHGETGEVVDVSEDELGQLFDDPRLNYLVTVEFDDESLGTMTFRIHDLEKV